MSLMEATVTRKHGSNDQFELGSRVLLDEQSAMPASIDDADYKTRAMACNVRETPIEYLFAKGEIKHEHRAAADKFRETCEGARMSSGGVIDPGALRVDQHMSISAKPGAIDAARNLAQLQGKLGIADFELLVQSCTVGRTVTEITKLVYRTEVVEATDRKYLGRRIRDALVIVSVHFGLSGKAKGGQSRNAETGSGWRDRHRSYGGMNDGLTGGPAFSKKDQDQRRT